MGMIKVDRFFHVCMVFVLFASLMSCASQPHPRPRAGVSISPRNITSLVNATVGFVARRETLMSQINPLITPVEPPPEWTGPYCAGFFIDEDHLVSAAHCFQHTRVLIVNGFMMRTLPVPLGEHAFFVEHGGLNWPNTVVSEPIEAEVYLWDEDNDIVILQVVDRDFTPQAVLPLADTLPQRGADVFHVGHPHNVGWSFFVGTVSNRISGDPTDDTMINTLQIQLPISPGCSGGPVVDSNGEIVCLVNSYYGTGSEIGVCHSASVIRRLVSTE